MSRVPGADWNKIARIGLPATGAGSWLASLAGTPKTVAIIIGALMMLAAIVAALPGILDSVYRHKAAILKEKKEVITAKSKARALERRSKTERKIIMVGLKSAGKAGLAERMIRARARSSSRQEGARLPGAGPAD